MRDGCSLIWLALIGLFRSRASLQAEILTLRHQLNVLRRKSPQRLTFSSIDRRVFAGLYRLAPGVRTFQSTRTRRRREQYMPLVAFCLRHFLADFIICMCEFDFRQAQACDWLSAVRAI